MRAGAPTVASVAVMLLTACRQPAPKMAEPPPPAPVTTLAVLPAESDRFPSVAEAITASLTKATVNGVDRTEVSKVSLEIVQLSIECVEPTVDCYEAVGKSLAANRLLFAELEPDGKRRVRVTVTLFDVDSRAPKTAKKVFASEQDASAGVADLVAEATR